MKYLFVVAHPDDETLGAGGMITSLIKKKNDVTVCIMSSKAEARSEKSNEDEFKNEITTSIGILGCKNIIFGDFPNIKFNTVPHLDMVKFIEDAIVATEPDVVVTHHPSDLNCDHRETWKSAQAAVRIFQRRNDVKEISTFMYMEVLSCTDWTMDKNFNPNYFYEIGIDGIDTKIKALKTYKGVIREYPHPRSEETIKALATYRGSQSKLIYAEGFEIAFMRGK